MSIKGGPLERHSGRAAIDGDFGLLSQEAADSRILGYSDVAQLAGVNYSYREPYHIREPAIAEGMPHKLELAKAEGMATRLGRGTPGGAEIPLPH